MVNQGNQRYYIQVAYDMTSEEKQTQEFNSLRNISDSFKNANSEAKEPSLRSKVARLRS